MFMINSRVLEKLHKGDLVRVAGMSRVVDPWLVEIIGRTGYDVIWLDLEHRAYGYEIIDPLSLAGQHAGIDLIVRVRRTGYDSPMRARTLGPHAIMVRHCRSAADARQRVGQVGRPPG